MSTENKNRKFRTRAKLVDVNNKKIPMDSEVPESKISEGQIDFLLSLNLIEEVK